MGKHAMAKPAVWWGCSCAWYLWRPAPPPDEDESLGIASRWVFSGDDELRRVASHRSEQPNSGCCQWLLKAVVNSGGVLGFPDQPVDRPTPDLAGKFVEGFVHQLMAKTPPVERAQVAQTFVQLARQTLHEPLPVLAANLA